MPSEELDRRHSEIEGIELSQEEKEKAIWNYKVWKWNRDRNAEYWNGLENKKLENNDSQRSKVQKGKSNAN